MEARMKNPAMVLDAMPAIQGLYKAMYASGIDPRLLELVHLRASQINGCSACVSSGVEQAKKHGETDERLHQVVAWRMPPLHRRGAQCAHAGGGGDPAGGSPGRGDRRDLGRGRRLLRRAAAVGHHPDDRDHQLLQPDQRLDPRARGCYLELTQFEPQFPDPPYSGT